MKSAESIYSRRKKPVVSQRQTGSGKNTSVKAAARHLGDVVDAYLRGQAGGESHPFYDERKPKK